MVAFSLITQDPAVRAYVQDGLLERDFYDALFPELKFRSMVEAIAWPEHSGDRQVFTGDGLYQPSTRPLQPNQDPVPQAREKEQWEATIQGYGGTGDVQMATSALAPVDLFAQEAKALGKAAGQSMNRKVRNLQYNAGMSGNTTINGSANSATQTVHHLAGFTRARRPDLAAGSPVRFDPVSSSNPLAITIGGTAANVTGFTPVNPGDEFGPGTLTLDGAVNATDRQAVLASNRSFLVYMGGGTRVDDIAAGDTFTASGLRAMVSRLRGQNVPEMPDRYYYMHIDPTTENQLFSDFETQRLFTSLPDYVMYKEFSVGQILGVAVLRNTECPVTATVRPKDGTTYTLDDDFAGELFSNGNASTGVPIHRPILLGGGGIKEYWLNYLALVSDAGMLGKSMQPRVDSDGITVMTERIYMLIRPPQNRMQDIPSITWAFKGAWAIRTDATSGDAAAYKREVVAVHSET